MSKVFRIYQGGSNTIQGWTGSTSFPYVSANRDTIADPNGASARYEITSIPSPFARIDLVKTAFREVCKIGIDGQTIFHKMVSDSLDVGEIFFNIYKYPQSIEIISCNISAVIGQFNQDGNQFHGYLGDALDKFFRSDGPTYNYGNLRNIYLLNYRKGPNMLNIIGATSPATLFFCSANDLSYVKNIYFNLDKPFDDEYQPLYKRDFEYVKAWFALREAIPGFATLMPEVNDYLNETYRLITDQHQRNQLMGLDVNSLSLDFDTIDVWSQQQMNMVEVMGYPVPRRKQRGNNIASDFNIRTRKPVTGPLPLVLPVEGGNLYQSLYYVSGQWGTTNRAPYQDPTTDYTRRTLPYDGSVGSYLTISDFLEDVLIRMPYSLNGSHYFGGNLDQDIARKSYLIPVKPLLFKFFTVDELMGEVAPGRKMFEMTNMNNGSVRVKLRIPIKGRGNVSYVEYARSYPDVTEPDIQYNLGAIVEIDFTGLIMPMVRFDVPQDDAFYTVSCITPYSTRLDMKFYDDKLGLVKADKACRNADGKVKIKSENYTIQGSNFCLIQVSDSSGRRGLLIPKFGQQSGVGTFEVAVDLGTSNTHVEYRRDGLPGPISFDCNVENALICGFHIPTFNNRGDQEDLNEEMSLIEKDFLPLTVGGGDFKFPTRTAISEARSINWNEIQYPYSLYNNSLTYDKRVDLSYNRTLCDIKWNESNNERVLGAYIDSLLLMIRNKVLMDGGNLSQTRLTWFYPTSMSPRRKAVLEQSWTRSFSKYFAQSNGLRCMTESAAPIAYYFNSNANAASLVNIDMGGGTTDVAFAINQQLQCVSSFRFATNVLFEDAYAPLNQTNGIIDSYRASMVRILQERGLQELNLVAQSGSNATPSNMASFLFSLKDNSLIRKARIDQSVVDFEAILRRDDSFKIVFIIYFASIIYHIAQIVKVKGLQEPRHIAFSGNGSKIVRVLSTDNGILSQFCKIIFEKVLNRPYRGNLDILGLGQDASPKEVTCKGGIVSPDGQDYDADAVILLGDGSGSLANPDLTYAQLGESAEIKGKIVNEVKAFFDYVLDGLGGKFDYDNNFGVTEGSLTKAREICYKDLEIYLDKGISQHMDVALGVSNKLEETAFFYPIKGVINELSKALQH